MSGTYSVVAHPSCDVSPTLRSSLWSNANHWHVMWPDGDHWCYETEAEAGERLQELFDLAEDALGHRP